MNRVIILCNFFKTCWYTLKLRPDHKPNLMLLKLLNYLYYIYLFFRHYEKYGDVKNLLTRNHFYNINFEATKLVFNLQKESEINLFMCKIFLYLGNHHMDQHYYDRALVWVEKCEYFAYDLQEQEHSQTTEVIN